MGLVSQVSAIPLTIGDAYYLGLINPGIPSGEAKEEEYIDQLASMAAPSGPTIVGVNTFTRSANDFGPLPAADFSSKDDDGNNAFTLDGSTDYVLGKYAQDQAGSLVWYVNGFIGDVTLPATFNGHDLSHTSFFGGGPGVGVPDGGATIALLGFALLGVDFLRRRIVKA